MTEIWKIVDETQPFYAVSNFGRVKSLGGRSGSGEKLLKLHNNSVGYPSLELHFNKKRKAYLVHRLVAKAFIPRVEGKLQVNHKDSNRTNNHVTNLEWCTPLENAQHAGRMGRMPRGETHKLSKLTELQVKEIRQLHGVLLNREIAANYGITRRAVDYIVARKRWGHVN